MNADCRRAIDSFFPIRVYPRNPWLIVRINERIGQPRFGEAFAAE